MSIEDKDREAAIAYVKAHVIYADKPGRFEGHLESLESIPEHYPEAETCDGCEKDSIAVYQSFLAGISYGRQSPDREMLARLIRFASTFRYGTADHVIDQFLQSEASKEK